MRVHKLLENAQAIKKEAQEKQYPDHVRLKTARVKNGETLGRFADISNAVVLNADDAISDEAKKTAATLFDYVRDLLDLGDMASCSEKVGYNRDLEALLRELEGLGATVYSALRPMKMCGENWEDKTPVSLEVGYLTVVRQRMCWKTCSFPADVAWVFEGEKLRAGQRKKVSLAAMCRNFKMTDKH